MERFAFAGVVGMGWIAFACAPPVSAQFHSKKPSGQTGVNQAGMAAAAAHPSMGGSASVAGRASSGASVSGGGMGGGDTILPPGAREAFGEHNVRLGQMQGKQVDIWGRAVYHGDGTFTESQHDNVTKTLEQTTKSKNGVTLQVRKITLDEFERPSESLIFDARNQFKYRGVLVYDTLGRFSEEQIYDAKGTLIRRKVQEYDPRGEKLPVRSWDYVANVPEDLKLVVTREDGASTPGSQASAAPTSNAAPSEKKPKFRLFGNKRQE